MSITVRDLTGVGEAAAQLLAKLHIYTPADLLFHLPRDYEDRSRIITMNQLIVGKTALLQGTIQSVDFPPGKRASMAIQISDGLGKVTLRFYQVYKALTDKFKMGASVRVFGEVRVGARGLELYHPEYQFVSKSSPLPASRLTAIYPTTEGLTQAKLRLFVEQALTHHAQNLPELLPSQFVKHYDMQAALRYIHQPPADANIFELIEGRHPAQQRLIFEELVAHQLSLLTRRYYIQSIAAPTITPSKQLAKQLIKHLPFQPTGAQVRVSAEILADLKQTKPMLRLVQGDVGAGKTLVAAIAACHVLESNWQVALMAPTEILAEQHFINFSQWFTPLGIQVAWLSGKQKGKAREQSELLIKTGQAQLAIGTHALFQTNVEFRQLGLVIIDEQHRFGVDQRLALREKGSAGTTPHQLVMTATPIPRTLAMSAYGDLDTSIIDELPPGRTPITTVTIPFEKREQVIARVAANCTEGKQAYWVCTLVEQSETLDAQAAEDTFADLSERLPHLKIGLVHGRMKPDEKQRVMQEFKQNKLHLLIATTVIEVGVDVPNASLMIIENAERLGLSQLHQLRGRVGRGSTASFCVLMYKSPLSENGTERLSTLRASTDGFVIAEKDLELRGPGEILGTRQTGLLGFRVANLQRDEYLLPQAQHVAAIIIKQHNELAEPLLQRWLPEAPRYAYV
ncbi:MAG: ATP-dependent DNA helicase RecG [Moraxellaceae bacterium]|nr:MAG: ATP-dependent DNA helicase RecG [Moraxellaceae bacterium]